MLGGGAQLRTSMGHFRTLLQLSPGHSVRFMVKEVGRNLRPREAMNSRGEYRCFYLSILDDPEFQAMDGLTFKLLFALKMSQGPGGIGCPRKSGLTEVLGCSSQELETSLALLEKAKPGERLGWIIRERNVIWLVNGLRHELGLSAKSLHHRSCIEKQLQPLGEKAIAARFRAYYREWFPEGCLKGEGSNRLASGSGGGREGVRDHIKRETRDEKVETTNGETKEDEFLERFYASASPQRRNEITAQLRAALSPQGVRIRGGDFVRAASRAHLDQCLAETIRSTVRDPDKAIVVVLRKLCTSERKPQLPASPKVAKTDRQTEDRVFSEWETERRAAATKWQEAHPEKCEELRKRAETELGIPTDMPGFETARQIFVTQKAAEAAGFPGFEEWKRLRGTSGPFAE